MLVVETKETVEYGYSPRPQKDLRNDGEESSSSSSHGSNPPGGLAETVARRSGVREEVLVSSYSPRPNRD